MKRKHEENQKTEEQHRAEAQERREQQRREERSLEYLPSSVAVWLLTIFDCIVPFFTENSDWMFFSLAVLSTIVLAVVDFRRRGFTEKSWLSLILDAILMAIALIIII